jgi:hypothetical protein
LSDCRRPGSYASGSPTNASSYWRARQPEGGLLSAWRPGNGSLLQGQRHPLRAVRQAYRGNRRGRARAYAGAL